MRTLDLFSGIGGFALAAHWMGWETAAFVEWDGFCQKVLRKNFPNTPIYGDITQFSYESERDRIGPIDLVCGGFPCQPFSTAGKRNGTADDRYLWPEMLRVIREVKPAFVVGENVAGLISMDGGDLLESICSDLEGEGYAVQPFIVPALSVGAPHRRDRVWIVAQNTLRNGRPNNGDQEGAEVREQWNVVAGNRIGVCFEPNPSHATRQQTNPTTKGRFQPELGGLCLTTPNYNDTRMEGQPEYGKDGCEPRRQHTQQNGHREPGNWATHWHEVATRFCRVDDGVSSELDKLRNSNRTKRIKALGNAIVPQVAYEIFHAIAETYGADRS